jgi:HEPN domain-containing protein
LQAGRFYAASSFAQQAAEKGLKALWVERLGEVPPRTHDLRFFGTELQVPRAVKNDFTHAESRLPAGTVS